MARLTYGERLDNFRAALDRARRSEDAVPAILEIPQCRSLKFPSWLSAQRVVAEVSGWRACWLPPGDVWVSCGGGDLVMGCCQRRGACRRGCLGCRVVAGIWSWGAVSGAELPGAGAVGAHPVGLAGCDHDVRVMEQAVQEADRGGVLGQERGPRTRTASGWRCRGRGVRRRRRRTGRAVGRRCRRAGRTRLHRSMRTSA